MLAYYGYTISPNQMETVEGFLICRNVPIARTGRMDYLESELRQDGSSSKMVAVFRTEEEVFSSAALSSFEGKPVTDDHPSELLTPDNCMIYLKGHAENVRRGTGEWSECVVADLHIQDKELIRAVQDGKREISCGYECSYSENEDGTYSQHEIRGNHIAVVARGRAGKHVAILDSKKNKIVVDRPERTGRMKKNSLFFRLFAQAAKDATPEELESMAADAAEAMDVEKPAPVESKKESEKKEVQDASTIDRKLDQIMDMLAKKEKEASVKEKDPLDALMDQLTGSVEDENPESKAEAEVVSAEEKDQISCAADQAVMAAVVKKLRPVIAGIQDEETRKAVTDSLIAALTDNDAESDIQRISRATQKNAAKLADQSPKLDLESYQNAYDAMNPHKQNGGTK